LKVYANDKSLPFVTVQNTPAGRMVLPEDVANLVYFLCSDESFMIRGQVITIDGGYSIAPVMPGVNPKS